MALNQHSKIVNFFETAGLEVATAILGVVAGKVKERVAASEQKTEKVARKTRKAARKPRAKRVAASTTADAPHALSGAEQIPLPEAVAVE